MAGRAEIKERLGADSGRIRDSGWKNRFHDTKTAIIQRPHIVSPTETRATTVWITDTPCHAKFIWGLKGIFPSVSAGNPGNLMSVTQEKKT